jgi:hypothetical protein
MTSLYTLEDSNHRLIECVQKGEPFFISRISDNISKVSLNYLQGATPHPQRIGLMQTHDGIYCTSESDVDLYARLYNKGILSSTYISCFDGLYSAEQNTYLKRKGADLGLDFRVLEPFYLLDAGIRPWTHELLGKKVLIIHPFVETFQEQMRKGFSFFEDRSIFLPGQELVYYKAFNTLANNRIHKNWFETFSIMCKEIKALDFDVALLGCGGYGIPLCSFINGSLKKSAVYVGGGLQLLFGVGGKRWLNQPLIKRESERAGSLWTRPSEAETIVGNTMIEGGCYW